MKSTYVNTVERGILTSAYKREIKQSIAESKRNSLSSFKDLVENHQARTQSQTGTILQVSLFAFAFILMMA